MSVINKIDQQFEELRKKLIPLTIKEKIDHIYDMVDDHFLDGKFHSINVWLKTVNIRKRSTDELIAILTAINPGKDKLEYHRSFFMEVKEEIIRRGEFEDNLLTGLEYLEN